MGGFLDIPRCSCEHTELAHVRGFSAQKESPDFLLNLHRFVHTVCFEDFIALQIVAQFFFSQGFPTISYLSFLFIFPLSVIHLSSKIILFKFFLFRSLTFSIFSPHLPAPYPSDSFLFFIYLPPLSF